ncbi:MAG: hypothetical protein NT164_09055 [Verrucomicrobiae bacterium]|nr:hypothetical protein [Verrucomicrobiae bacterium]
MTRYSEQVLALRIEAAEISEEKQEEQVVQYSLAAFAMSDAAESLIQMMKVAISENQSLALQWQETIPLLL